MNNEEWLFTGFVVFLAFIHVVHVRLVYKHGIWDGAFNQFLPYVRKSILEYDERRGRKILGDDVL